MLAPQKARCPRSPIWRLASVALLATAALPLRAADVVLHEPFDGPNVSWRVAPSSAVRVLAQLRTRAPDPTDPRTAERVVLTCPAGYAARVEHEVGQLPVLDELSIEAVVRANRPGTQLAAEVVFPRSIDPRTQQPHRTLVHGHRYSAPGAWQTLRVDKLPLLAERQARLMNADPNQQVDHREAYVQRVVLVVPGGPGESLAEVDQLTARGIASVTPNSGSGEASVFGTGGDEGPLLQAPGMANQQRESFEPVQVSRRGDTLSVAGTALVPRVAEHRGEPFELFTELGFNTVWLDKPPTEAQLRAARAAKLWVICPPPPSEELRDIAVDSVWQTVLAWSLGLDRDALSLDGTASQADEIRQIDPLQRPLLIGALDRQRRFAQLADVLVRGRPIVVGDNFGDTESAALPLLGCSPWTQLSLAWHEDARRQAELFAPRASHLGWHEPRALRCAALTAMSEGARGMVVRTPDRLGGTSPEARRLADQLQLLNRELHLVEPWLVSGKRIAGAELSNSDRTTTAWQLGRSRLVFIPPRQAGTTKAEAPIVLVVAGVPETARAHLLSPAGLLPLEGRLVAGGYQVQLLHVDAGAWVVLTDDARSLAWAQRRIGNLAAKSAQTQRDMAMAEVLELEAVESQLASPKQGVSSARLEPLKRGLQQCDQMLAGRQYSQTFHLAGQLRHEASVEQQRLEQLFAGRGFVSVPTRTELRLLPTHQALEQSLAMLPRGGNLLAGGDFEDLASTRGAGWQHANYAESQMTSSVEFVPGGYHGAASLRLTARDTARAAVLDDGQPEPVVWISSPRVPVRPGSIVEITGWARVATGDAAAGRLLVVDSLGGDQLALRISATTGWQPFRLVRMAGDMRNLQLKLALTGPATADIDAVMIREVVRPQRTASQPQSTPQ